MPVPLQPKTLQIPVRLFEPPTLDPGAPQKIILLKLGERIGDFIIALDAFRLLRDNFPKAEITLLCMPSIVSLAEGTGLFDRVKGFAHVPDVMNVEDPSKPSTKEGLDEFLALLDGSYSIAADFRHDGSTRPWLDEIKAGCRAGFAAQMQGWLDISLPPMEWDVRLAGSSSGAMPVHADMRLVMLARAIIETFHAKESEAAFFPVLPQAREAEAYRRLESETRLKIGLSVGAGSELRKWRADYWQALLGKLAESPKASFVFFGGPEDKEESAALAARLPQGSTHDLTGQIPLDHVPSYMKLLDAYIGCDTGLTHLAGNLGLPTVNIFAGISNISVWRARGPRVKTVYAEVLCAPCHLRFKDECPNNNICMGAIAPEIVYACLGQLELGQKS